MSARANTACMHTTPHSRRATGREAQTVYRDRATGRIVSAEEFAASRAKKAGKPVYEEVHLEWKGGLAQARERAEARAAVSREAGKSFGRCELELAKRACGRCGGRAAVRGGCHTVHNGTTNARLHNRNAGALMRTPTPLSRSAAAGGTPWRAASRPSAAAAARRARRRSSTRPTARHSRRQVSCRGQIA